MTTLSPSPPLPLSFTLLLFIYYFIWGGGELTRDDTDELCSSTTPSSSLLYGRGGARTLHQCPLSRLGSTTAILFLLTPLRCVLMLMTSSHHHASFLHNRYGTGGIGSGSFQKLLADGKARSMRSAKSRSSKGGTGGSSLARRGIVMQLDSEPWFVGEMSRDRAEEKLASFPAGSFLVRKGQRGFAISLRFYREEAELDMFHVQIYSSVEPKMLGTSRVGEMKPQFWVEEGAKFNSVLDMIHFYMDNSSKFFSNLEGATLEIAGYKMFPVSSITEEVRDGDL